MLVQLTMFPTDGQGASVSKHVSRVIDIIDNSGLPYKLTAMATIIEGEWDEIMLVINEARKELKRNHSRLYISMTIDDRQGVKNRLEGKIDAIEKNLNREVKK
ncbi:MAG: thiamine-binding protein [Candidatus Zixiibacteriota bacterium]|nr:MAG: thiamine-binding protein [candidate division Zixibacteria bacterium]